MQLRLAKGQKTGGRQKGTKNKATLAKETGHAELIEAAKSEGITPLEFMLNVLRDESKGFVWRYKAALDAAPYMHPKLAATKVEGGDEPVKIETVVTWAGLSAGS